MESAFREENITKSNNGIVTMLDWDKLSDEEISNIIESKYLSAKQNSIRAERELIWEVAYNYYKNRYLVSNSQGKKPKEQALKTSTLFILIENLMAKMFRLMFHGSKIMEVEAEDEETPKEYTKIVEKWFHKVMEKNNYWFQMTQLLKQILLYGNGCVKLSWNEERYTRKFREMTPEGWSIVVEKDFIDKYPAFEVVDIRDVYPDPDATKEEDITYVVHIVRQRMSQILNKKNIFNNVDDLFTFVNNKITKKSAEKLKSLNKTANSSNNAYDDYDPMLELKCYYEKDRLIITCENIVLYNGENPYWCKKIPFLFIGNYYDLNTFYALGEIENGIAFQEAEDVTTQMTLNYIKSVLKVKLLVPDTAKIDEVALKDMDNRIVRADLPAEIEPINIPAVNISPALAIIEKLNRKMEDLTSMTDYQRGAPARQETAAGVYQIVEAGNTKFLFKVDMFEPFLRKLAQWMVELQHQFMDDKEQLKTKNDIGQEVWIRITPEIFSYRYKYKFIGSANAENKNILFNKAMSLYQMLVNRPDIQQDYLLEYVLGIADYPNLNIEKLIKENGISNQDRILKQKEINREIQQPTTQNLQQPTTGQPIEEQVRAMLSEAGNPLNILNGGNK